MTLLLMIGAILAAVAVVWAMLNPSLERYGRFAFWYWAAALFLVLINILLGRLL